MRYRIRRSAKPVRGNFAEFLSPAPPRVNRNRNAPGENKKLAWTCSKPARWASHQPIRFSSGSNNADTCEIGGRCSSTAAQCSNTFDNKDSHRSSCNSFVGSIHSSPGDRNNCTGMRGNQIRFRLLRHRLKPEHQLVLPAPEPVRLLPTEVKEVFS